MLEEEESPNQQTIEDNFDGHICRCTGYRSILDAMKCFACDADSSLRDKCQDIEVSDVHYIAYNIYFEILSTENKFYGTFHITNYF